MISTIQVLKIISTKIQHSRLVHITCMDHVSLLQDQHYKPFTAMLIKICSRSLSITPPEDDPMLKAHMNNHEWSRDRKTMKLTSKIFAPRLQIK